MQNNLGDRQAFNVNVGDVDERGRSIKRQFSYYPHAQPKPVLVPEGGAIGEEALQAESLTPDGNIMITEDTTEQPLAFWWQATQKQRTFLDEVAAGTRDPYPTVDGLPVEDDNADQDPDNPNDRTQTRPDITVSGPEREDLPPFQQTPTQPEQQQAPGMIPIDIASFSEMQRQLIVAQIEPLVELQDMVIQTQAILLSELLEPSSPHHRIMEMWMSKLESMKANNTNGQAAEPESEA